MILKNGLVFTEDARFVLADVEIADGKIAQVAAPGTLDGPDAVDVSGKYVTPGFVDIHIHDLKKYYVHGFVWFVWLLPHRGNGLPLRQ